MAMAPVPLLRTVKLDLGPFVFGEPAREIRTPLQEVLRRAAELAGTPVRCTEVSLSRELLEELTRRTTVLANLYAPPEAAARLVAAWLKEARPCVALGLGPTECLVQLEPDPADGRRRSRSEPVPQGEAR